MYDKMWGRPTPGHIIFMIDQSGSMDGEKAQMAVECIQNSLVEIVLGSLDGTKIKDRAYITVIGYGRHSKPVSIIREGWVSEWLDDVLKAKKSKSTVIEVVDESDSWDTPMTEAFELAKKCLDAWIAKREEDAQKNPTHSMAAPIVINITDGMPNDKNSAKTAAESILNTETPDGNVLLFNAHINIDNTGAETICPSDRSEIVDDEYKEAAEFLYGISSKLTDKQVAQAKAKGFETVTKGAMGFVANVRKATLVRFIEFGSELSQK